MKKPYTEDKYFDVFNVTCLTFKDLRRKYDSVIKSKSTNKSFKEWIEELREKNGNKQR